MNIRETAGLAPNYFEINREERNYAAILFAALCQPGNVEQFLALCKREDEVGPEFGIYFEYAYLRDLWFQIDSEDIKRSVIRNHLKIQGIEEIMARPAEEINRLFGVAGTPSATHIQFPGKWALVKYAENFKDKDDLLQICRFKWSFNIKPDIVIHLSKSKAICIEAKVESGEGTYPSSEAQKAIFRRHELEFVKQTELQRFMMEDLLGIETDFWFLVKKGQSSLSHKEITWERMFSGLDLSVMPAFALEMVNRISAKDGEPIWGRG